MRRGAIPSRASGDATSSSVEPASNALLGGDDRDALFGEADGDRLIGGADSDRLNGGLGSDLLAGGPGEDSIEAVDGLRDTVTCGGGRDFAHVDPIDAVRGCERVRSPAPAPGT